MDEEHSALKLGLPTPQVASLCHVPISTLNHWVATGLCTPTLVTSSGKRATRFWSVRDVVIARAIKSLRDAGCSLQNVRSVAALLETNWDRNLANSVLFWDGADVLSIDEAGDVMSLLHQTGQAVIRESVMHLLTFPLGAWIGEASAVAHLVPVETIRARREQAAILRGREAVVSIRR